MLSRFFKIAWRNLARSRTFSLVNIGGLAIGMASAMLILLWIHNEFSYDLFHVKKDRIYLLENRQKYQGNIEVFPGMPQPLAPLLMTEYPQIEAVARINGVASLTLTVGDRHFEDKDGLMTDPGFLKIFSFPLAVGDIETALSGPRSMVITQSFAKRFFANEDAMGKLVRIDSNTFSVTGIAIDPPRNTNLRFDFLIPYSYMKDTKWANASWKDFSAMTFVLLRPGVTGQMADDRLRDILKTHAGLVDNEVFLHPLTKWNLYSRWENGKIAGGGIENVRLFGLIAAIILFIACINYMNLSTARSIKRAREVGIRKVVGARRSSIVIRFLGESILVSLLSGIFGLVIVQLSIEGFNWLTWDNLVVPYGRAFFWLGFVVFVVVTGLIAGSYPAFYLSGFRPISVLKGNHKVPNEAALGKAALPKFIRTAYNLVSVRKILVVFQFACAIVFMVCTIVIARQIEYGRKRDPGYNRDHLVFAYAKGDMNKKYALIKNELLASGAATAVTRTNSPITFSWSADDSYAWRGKGPNLKISIDEYHADNDFLETTGIKLLAGRTINTVLYPTDTMAILLNESAVKLMGFKNPIGEIVNNKQGNWTVIGVIKDFVLEDPLNGLHPAIIQGPRNWFGAITFKLNPRYTMAADMQKIEAIFRKYNPEYPFIYQTVADADNGKLEGIRRQGIQSALFGGMAIFISCLGLFALAAYTAESRIKEIGVRKVLGASVAGITTLLSGNFLKLVGIAFGIASPVAWWIMHSWLERYPYHIQVGWWVFVLAGLISMVIALVAVGYQSVRAAMANPIRALRNE